MAVHFTSVIMYVEYVSNCGRICTQDLAGVGARVSDVRAGLGVAGSLSAHAHIGTEAMDGRDLRAYWSVVCARTRSSYGEVGQRGLRDLVRAVGETACT